MRGCAMLRLLLMKTAALIAVWLLWLAIDRAVTLTEAHSPAPSPAEWQKMRAAHLADR